MAQGNVPNISYFYLFSSKSDCAPTVFSHRITPFFFTIFYCDTRYAMGDNNLKTNKKNDVYFGMQDKAKQINGVSIVRASCQGEFVTFLINKINIFFSIFANVRMAGKLTDNIATRRCILAAIKSRNSILECRCNSILTIEYCKCFCYRFSR